jgi:hypothetical protein
LGLHVIARGKAMDAAHLTADSINAAERQQTKVVRNADAARLAHDAQVLNWIGFVFTVSSLLCIVVAVIRQERGWYSIPLLLLFFDLIAAMLA